MFLISLSKNCNKFLKIDWYTNKYTKDKNV